MLASLDIVCVKPVITLRILLCRAFSSIPIAVDSEHIVCSGVRLESHNITGPEHERSSKNLLSENRVERLERVELCLFLSIIQRALIVPRDFLCFRT
jgi:hypothetical protein